MSAADVAMAVAVRIIRIRQYKWIRGSAHIPFILLTVSNKENQMRHPSLVVGPISMPNYIISFVSEDIRCMLSVFFFSLAPFLARSPLAGHSLVYNHLFLFPPT